MPVKATITLAAASTGASVRLRLNDPVLGSEPPPQPDELTAASTSAASALIRITLNGTRAIVAVMDYNT
jgi:hypothetical protein